MHKVGFTQANAAIDKQRVIGSTGIFSDLLSSGKGQLIGLTLNKTVKGEIAI